MQIIHRLPDLSANRSAETHRAYWWSWPAHAAQACRPPTTRETSKPAAQPRRWEPKMTVPRSASVALRLSNRSCARQKVRGCIARAPFELPLLSRIPDQGKHIRIILVRHPSEVCKERLRAELRRRERAPIRTLRWNAGRCESQPHHIPALRELQEVVGPIGRHLVLHGSISIKRRSKASSDDPRTSHPSSSSPFLRLPFALSSWL